MLECVCVCVCVEGREGGRYRDREEGGMSAKKILLLQE